MMVGVNQLHQLRPEEATAGTGAPGAMRPFSFVRPSTHEEAQALLTASARPKGGGMDLLDLAKRGVSTPATMVDLSRVPDLGKTWRGDHGETYLGAGMTLADVAASAEIAKH